MDVNNISFGAVPINTVTIKKFDNVTKKYRNCKANFVAIDGTNKNDLIIISEAAKKWKNALYMRKIDSASRWMNCIKDLKIDIFAITEQNNNFDNLELDKILGFAEIRNNPDMSEPTLLHRLQVKPEAINFNKSSNTPYKKVGTAILKSLKNLYSTISLFSINNPCVEAFYKKNGFIEDFLGERHYIWTSDIFKKLKIIYNKFLILAYM